MVVELCSSTFGFTKGIVSRHSFMMDRPVFTNVCEATSQSHELDNLRPIHRKGKKLLAEKKRRARINNCLVQIRDLVCEGDGDKDTDIDKMEKAEILEKTLEVLTRVRREHNTTNLSSSLHSSPNARRIMAVRYASGFSSCAEESIRYIQNSRLVPSEVKSQLQSHLRTIARRMEKGFIEPEALPSPGMPMPSPFMPSPQYPSMHHQFSPAASIPSRRIPAAMMCTGNDFVTSSGQHEVDQIRSRLIPSPIHTSTPVITQPRDNKSNNVLPSEKLNTMSLSNFTSSNRYECVTPEIDVVDTEKQTTIQTVHSRSLYPQQQQQHITDKDLTRQQSTPDLYSYSTHNHHATTTNPSSPAFPTTPSASIPAFSIPAPYHAQKPSQQHPHSSLPVPATIPTMHPSSLLTSSATSPSYSCQTIYGYRGYEPYPTSSYTSTPCTPSSSYHSYINSFKSDSSSCKSTPSTTATSTTTSKPQTISQVSPALDLCVKRDNPLQISPETMWRPW